MDGANEKLLELLTMISARPSTLEIIYSLLTALGLSLIMWLTYRKANTDSGYQPRFAVTLITLALLSTVLMDLVQSNLALSLGMLGSLSIVRFRTNIRDPRDIGFIFWAMAIGLAASTGSYAIGIVGSIAVAGCMISTARCESSARDMLLVVRGSRSDLEQISQIVRLDCVQSQVKAKNIMSDSYELVYDVRVDPDSSNGMIDRLFALQGIDTVNLLSAERAIS